MSKGFFAASKTKSRNPADSRTPKCGLCRLNKTCKTPRMPVAGEGRRRILVVAEAPGALEDKTGEPLVGESGQRLAEHMERVGLDLNVDCWKTNAVLCRPPKNRTPNSDEIDGCRPFLLRTIAKRQPSVVLLLGSVAVDGLLAHSWRDSVGALGRWVGWRIPCPSPQAWVVVSWHPSYLLRRDEKSLDRLFESHLSAAKELSSTDPPTKRNWAQEVHVEHSPRVAAKLIRRFSNSAAVAFDYETTALKPETPKSKIVCSAISNGIQTVAFPWTGPARRQALELLADENVGKIAHNLKFEDRWTRLRGKGVVRNWLWDSMVAAHVLDNRTAITGLKFQAFVRLGIASYDDSIRPYLKGKPLNRADKADPRDLLKYCGMDALATYELAMIQMQESGIETN